MVPNKSLDESNILILEKLSTIGMVVEMIMLIMLIITCIHMSSSCIHIFSHNLFLVLELYCSFVVFQSLAHLNFIVSSYTCLFFFSCFSLHICASNFHFNFFCKMIDSEGQRCINISFQKH